jgi:hypothetical protein
MNITKMASDMLNAFVASVGARSFDLSILDINGDEVEGRQRPNSTFAEIRRTLEWTLQNAEEKQQSVVIRPRHTSAAPIQLDDLDTEKAQKITPHAFLVLCTSLGNFQAWLALIDAPRDNDDLKAFKRRLKRGIGGADKNATGATRIAGSRNFKTKYAPNFPLVEMTYTNAGHKVTMAELEQAGFVAPPEVDIALAAPASVPRRFRASRAAAVRKWPDYQRALAGAPPNHDGDGRDRSLADFMWCKWALERGWSVDETADRLLEVSEKAAKQAREGDEGYARVTAWNAARAVEKNRIRSGQGTRRA